MSRYSAFHRARFRLTRIEGDFRGVLHTLLAEAESDRPYNGPSPQSLQRTLDDILAHQKALGDWLFDLAAKPRGRRKKHDPHEVVMTTADTKTDRAAVLKEAFTQTPIDPSQAFKTPIDTQKTFEQPVDPTEAFQDFVIGHAPLGKK